MQYSQTPDIQYINNGLRHFLGPRMLATRICCQAYIKRAEATFRQSMHWTPTHEFSADLTPKAGFIWQYNWFYFVETLVFCVYISYFAARYSELNLRLYLLHVNPRWLNWINEWDIFACIIMYLIHCYLITFTLKLNFLKCGSSNSVAKVLNLLTDIKQI